MSRSQRATGRNRTDDRAVVTRAAGTRKSTKPHPHKRFSGRAGSLIAQRRVRDRAQSAPKSHFASDEWNFAFQTAQADIEERRDLAGVWRSGLVRTPHGFVAVFSGDREFTQYRFPFRGRMYTRAERRDASSRALAIAAAKFARRIAGPAR